MEKPLCKMSLWYLFIFEQIFMHQNDRGVWNRIEAGAGARQLYHSATMIK